MKPSASSSNSWLGAGLLAAVAASLCCITPVLAVLGGIGSIAATFSWLEPFRPYLMGATVLVLGFAWYQKLMPKPAQEIDCACEVDEKPSFFQSKAFLGIVTVLALVLLGFPYYSAAFFPEKNTTTASVSVQQRAQAKLFVQGMTCSGCEHSVNHALAHKAGVVKASSSYQTGIALVTFDQSKVTPEELARTVTEATGYTVTRHELRNKN